MKLLERAAKGEVATEAASEEERQDAWKLLDAVVKDSKYTREQLQKSLTVPPGEEYFESTLLRFLRARKGKLEDAKKMIVEAMDFRERYQVDNILERPLAKSLLRHMRKGFFDGFLPTFDKFGRPVYCLQGGLCASSLPVLLQNPPDFEAWDLHNLEDFWVHWHLIMIEYLTKHLFAEATRKAGRLINMYVVIEDLKGFSLLGMNRMMQIMSVFKKTTYVDQLLYPEIMAVMMVLNAPAIFRGPWKVISSFVDKSTVEKIFMLSGPSHYEAAVDVLFDRALIPPFMGGTLEGNHVTSAENPDTIVFDKIDELCLKNGQAVGFPTDKRCTPLQSVNLGAGKEKELEMEIDENHHASWFFAVDSHDVGFRAVFQGENGTSHEVEPFTKINSSNLPLQHSWRAPSKGKVTFHLSNKGSKLRSKMVRYRLFSWLPTTPSPQPVSDAKENLEVDPQTQQQTQPQQTQPQQTQQPQTPQQTQEQQQIQQNESDKNKDFVDNNEREEVQVEHIQVQEAVTPAQEQVEKEEAKPSS